MSRLKFDAVSSIQLSVAYEAFQVFNRNKNLRHATITSYEYRLMVLKAFLRETKGKEDCFMDEIDEKWLSDYISWANKRGNKPISINNTLKNIRVFLSFAVDSKYISTMPKITFLKVDMEYKEPYTQAEILKLLKKPTRKYFPQYRTWSAINFVMGTGCRAGTLVNIRIGDIDFQRQIVRYGHTKNRKYQVVPLPPQLIKVLREYLSIRKGKDDDYLFPNHSGQQWTVRAVTDALQEYNRSRGVEKTSVHLLRHTFATEYIKAGGSIVALEKQLGHSSLEMTKRYIAMSGIDLETFIDFNPLQILYQERITM